MACRLHSSTPSRKRRRLHLGTWSPRRVRRGGGSYLRQWGLITDLSVTSRREAIENLHHIVSDGWSIGVFTRELTTLRRA